MLNDNKYYIPTKEEIYPELDIKLVDEDKDYNINPFVYRILNSKVDLRENIDIENFRIKYLDKDDIESLGFKQIESSFSHDIYEIPFSYKIIKDKISNLENHYFIHFINGYGGKETQIFSGFIKNKSELKVLLKQLGIDDKTN